MMKLKFSKIIIILFILFAQKQINAQPTNVDKIERFLTFQKSNLQEKLYLHIDRSFYLCGEILWFKIYYVDGLMHLPLDMSKVAYVEVLDSNNTPLLQSKVEMKDGKGSGSLFLPTTISSGNYTIRAYTNWMKNFDPVFYFHAPLFIVNTLKEEGIRKIEEQSAYDLQFFPEGGNLVEGFENRVAFKLVDQLGMGVDLNGVIINKENDTITHFNSFKFGMGSFNFVPEREQDYVAKIAEHNGKIFSFKLPKVQESGYVMRLDEKDNGNLEVAVLSNYRSEDKIMLIAHTRNSIKHVESKQLDNGKVLFIINKSKLGDGISHFTIFNQQDLPVCERLYFKKPVELLDIGIDKNQNSFSTRSKVEFQLQTKVKENKPANANLSVAVIKNDKTNKVLHQSIMSYLYLQSDLKGTVESIDWYFKNEGQSVDKALDNLMLTQGWRRFSWKQILDDVSDSVKHLPEISGHIINGKVFNKVIDQPANSLITYLSTPGNNSQLQIFRSDEKGNLHFELTDFYGPKNLIVSTSIVNDTINKFDILSPFSTDFANVGFGNLYNVNNTLEEDIYNRHIQMQAQNILLGDTINTYKKPKMVGLPFYMKSDKRYLLDDYTRFVVMEEVMREYVPEVLVRIRKGRFHYMVFDDQRQEFFDIDPLVLIDGVPIFDINKVMEYDPLKVEKLDIVTKKYNYGPRALFGIVSYSTYKGDLDGFPLDPSTLVLEYEGLQLEREFYSPKYDLQTDKYLPDFRNLVYWNPDINTTLGNAKIEFFTPDKPGEYIAIIQGMTQDGKVGYATSSFEVEELVK